VGADGVRGPGDGDPQPPVEIQAGRHVTDHHVEHVQVRRAIAAHVRSLPEQAAARTARRGSTWTDPCRAARAGASRLSPNSSPLPDQATARGRLSRTVSIRQAPSSVLWRQIADYLFCRRLSGRSQARSRCPVLSPPVDTGWARGFPGLVAGSGGCPAASVDAGSVAGARPLPGRRPMVQAGEPSISPLGGPPRHAGLLARHRQAVASDSCVPPASRAPRQGSPGRSGSGACPDSRHGTAPRLNPGPARFRPGCPPGSGSARCAPSSRVLAVPRDSAGHGRR